MKYKIGYNNGQSYLCSLDNINEDDDTIGNWGSPPLQLSLLGARNLLKIIIKEYTWCHSNDFKIESI